MWFQHDGGTSHTILPILFPKFSERVILSSPKMCGINGQNGENILKRNACCNQSRSGHLIDNGFRQG